MVTTAYFIGTGFTYCRSVKRQENHFELWKIVNALFFTCFQKNVKLFRDTKKIIGVQHKKFVYIVFFSFVLVRYFGRFSFYSSNFQFWKTHSRKHSVRLWYSFLLIRSIQLVILNYHINFTNVFILIMLDYTVKPVGKGPICNKILP